MGTYLYCILPPAADPPPCVGLDETSVRAIRVAGVACWVSDLPEAPEPTIERIRRHNQVVQAAMEAGVTPLPVRFGQWLPSEAEMEDALRTRQSAHLAALERLAGAVEFGVRVLDPAAERHAAEVEPAASGTAYLLALAAREQAERAIGARGQEIASRIGAVLGSIVREQRVEALASRHGVVSVAQLVERAAVERYRAGMERVRQERPELRFLVTGPWPPYSFVA